MSEIKTWQKRKCVAVTRYTYIGMSDENFMQEEIDELRAYIEKIEQERDGLLVRNQALLDQRESWRCLASKFEQERNELRSTIQELEQSNSWLVTQKQSDEVAYIDMRDQRDVLLKKLQELNLQQISDFGQLQEQTQKKDCLNCKYVHRNSDKQPCCICIHSEDYADKFELKE